MRAPEYTRVAVAQLAVHPAAVGQRRSPLEDPLFEPGKPDHLLPTDGPVPERFTARLLQLRARVRDVYCSQLRQRLDAILAACRAWDVKLLVLPEYGVPWELLPHLARAAPEMTVVAGSHTVSGQAIEPRAGAELNVYRELGWPEEREPEPGQAVCPVLRGGGLVALQPKLHRSKLETRLKPGDTWEPVAVPPPTRGPMGVLICLDFLYRESSLYAKLVREPLADCRFLAVPSLTPHYTLPEFAAKAWEEARRYGRPVLYADTAEGGTSIFVDEKGPVDLRDFPNRAGWLEPGDEGVVVADVDLGYERAGPSTPYEVHPPVRPVAAAALVYTTHPVAREYGKWLGAFERRIDEGGKDLVRDLVEDVKGHRDLILKAAELGSNQSRRRRLHMLLDRLPNVTLAADWRAFLREVVVPGDVLPLAAVRAAMAQGAADEVFGWLREEPGGGLEEVVSRLRDAGRPAREPAEGEWTEDGRAALARVAAAVRGTPERTAEDEGPRIRMVLPPEVEPAVLGRRVVDGRVFEFRRSFEDFRAREQELADRFAGGHGFDPGAALFPPVCERLRRLAVAEGSERASALVVREESQDLRDGVPLVLFHDGETWKLWHADPELADDPAWPATLSGLESLAFPELEVEVLTEDEVGDRVDGLAEGFAGGREEIGQFLALRLREVSNAFVEPDVTVVASGQRRAALAALDRWLASDRRTALVLGEFGSGKSTVLAWWANALWEHRGPRPILVNLAAAGPSADAEALLLRAAQLADTPARRAALGLLIARQRLLPIFDGFDEMVTRLTAGELAGRLAELLRVAGDGGRVVVSSRDHYFPSAGELDDAVKRALAAALDASPGVDACTWSSSPRSRSSG